jgi:hypothetical protein
MVSHHADLSRTYRVLSKVVPVGISVIYYRAVYPAPEHTRALPRCPGRRQCRARYLGEHAVTLRCAHELVLKPQREEGGGNGI